MPFTVFSTTTGKAQEVLDNFYHIADGERLPQTITAIGTLTAVGSTYDLGASSTQWSVTYADNINVSDSITTIDKTLWELVTELTLSATTNRIEITGLNGDVDGNYLIRFSPIIGSGNLAVRIFMVVNGDTGSNYGQQHIRANAFSGVSAQRETGQGTGWQVGDYLNNPFSMTCYNYFNGLLHAKTGNERTILCDEFWNIRVSAGVFLITRRVKFSLPGEGGA